MSKTSPRNEITEQAARLRLAITRTARRLRQSSASGGPGLGISAVAALASIERGGPLTASELADIEGVKRPTATRIIGRLVDEGLIQRSPDPADGRSSLLTVTAAGSELLRALRQRKDAFMLRRLQELPEQDLATLRRAAEILERMLEEERS